MREEVWKGVKVIHNDFPENQYYKEKKGKNQIVLHFLASGKGVKGDLNWWKSNKERVAACVTVQRNGEINTVFSSEHWAHHLGVKIKVFDKNGIDRIYKKRSNGKSYVANNEILNEGSIALELDSWGPLTKKEGKYYSWTNKEVPEENVVHYPEGYRGFNYFEKFTDEQIKSTKLLLKFWAEKYNIDISYKGDKMFDVCKEALEGEEGVWSHSSYRSDKSDIHPYPPLIKMLKTL